MQTLIGPAQFANLPRGLAVTIGNFDGVHCGHQALLHKLRQVSERGSLVITFDPHPASLLNHNSSFWPLMTRAVKQAALKKLGIDYLVTLPVTTELLSLSPETFWKSLREIQPRSLLVGPDFRFGHNREGSIGDLQTWAALAGIDFQVFSEIEIDLYGQKIPVHSQTIRSLMVTNKVNDALELLGHPYQLEGTVGRGYGRGQELGFPTANLSSIENLIPFDGVYQATTVLDHHPYRVALSVGTLPTFGAFPRQVEAHILEYKGDLSNTQLRLHIERYLRPQIKFPSVEALVIQITKDVEQIRRAAGKL